MPNLSLFIAITKRERWFPLVSKDQRKTGNNAVLVAWLRSGDGVGSYRLTLQLVGGQDGLEDSSYDVLYQPAHGEVFPNAITIIFSGHLRISNVGHGREHHSL